MKITRANVQEYAKQKGLNPIQVDGIPDGFAWKEDDLEISGIIHKGRIIKFTPMEEWDKGVSYE